MPIDYDLLYEEIDGVWPVKRVFTVKELEKKRLQELVKTEEDVRKLKNKIEIEIEDKKDIRKLPVLVNLIQSAFRQVTYQPIVSELYVVEASKEPNEAENLFEEIYHVWPENEFRQNKKFAKQAFLEAAKKHSLEDLKAACQRYVEENSSPEKASLSVLGIKRFVSEDDILDNWIARSKTPVDNYDTSHFDAAWAWYPEFKDNDKPEVKKDSLAFYKRFVKGNDVVDFYCAVKAYRSERIQEAKEYEDINDEEKYTKKFYNFIRQWKTYNCASYKYDLLIGLIIKVFKEYKIPYWMVYPEENHDSAVLHNCKRKNDNGEYIGCVEIVTKHFENVIKYLTTGENYCKIKVSVSADYGVVSKIVSLALIEAKKMPHKPTPECAL